MLKDEFGNVLLHSRRAFSNIKSLEEIKFQSLLWCTKSLKSHHIDNVSFASIHHDLVNAVLRPQAWPSFKFQARNYCLFLKVFRM